jgi:phosphatidylinositol alpha-1,6-mannosyltransferase
MRPAAFAPSVASPAEATGRSPVRRPVSRVVAPGLACRVNILGGNAYCSTGGIQAMNRLLVRELGAAGLLGQAFFLWDSPTTATEEGLDAWRKKQARFYSENRPAFLLDLARQAMPCSRDLWLCTHINYVLAGLAASLGRPDRVAVLLHAAELDSDFTAPKAWALKQAGCVIAVSEYTRKKALRLGVNPARVRVLPNAVEGGVTRPPAVRAPDAPPVLLFVGRMDERYKGQMELLDAMVLLRRRLPALRLVFVGEGRSLPHWKTEVIRRDLVQAVEFRGRLSDQELARAYAEATLFAMPSENEGFGLVYAEAMARGLPCIGSDRDAAGEVIVHGETGFLVPTGNSTALADAILALVRSPALRIRMGEAGRRRYQENFTPEKYRTRLLATLTEWRRLFV